MNRAGRRARAKLDRRRVRRTAAASGAVLTLGAWLLSPSGSAVADGGSTVVDIPGDAAVDGDGTTLREAIVAANATNGTVTFDPGLVGPITLTQGDIDIDGSITIDGPDGGITVFAAANSRVFDLIGGGAGGIAVAIDDLEIRNGSAGAESGGAIRGVDADLTLDRVIIVENLATNGAGISLSGNNRDIALTVRESTISINDASAAGGGISVVTTLKYEATVLVEGESTIAGNFALGTDGGGIHVFSKYAEVTISDSTVSGNGALDNGGGIHFDVKYGDVHVLDGALVSENSAGHNGGGVFHLTKYGMVEVNNASVSGNLARDGDGGGIHAANGKYSLVQLTNGAIVNENGACDGGDVATDNFCDPTGPGTGGRGGGIFVDGALDVSESTISGNLAVLGGGGVYAIATEPPPLLPFLALLDPGVGISIVDTTIDQNDALTGGGAHLDLDELSGRIERSTFSRNTASEFGGGLSVTGPGAYALDIVNSTISTNEAGTTGGGIQAQGDPDVLELNTRFATIANNISVGDGGGVFLDNTSFSADHVIVAGNAGDDGDGLGEEIAGNGVAGSSAALRFSLVQGSVDSPGDLAVTDDGGNVAGANPLLGPLTLANGGPTETHALPAGSPAHNAGDPAFVPPPDTDQRGPGFLRTVGARVDMGAFEFAPAPGGGGGGGSGTTVQFEVETSEVDEDAGPAQITILRTGATSGPSTVRVVSSPGTATSPADFTAVDEVVSFAADETTAVLPVAIVDDLLDEDNEAFTLVLSDPTDAALGAISATTVTIVDDVDVCGPGFVMPFDDVPAGNIHFEAIRCIAFLGITNGASEDGTKYEPDEEVSRAQMARFIANLLELHGIVLPQNPPDRFRDDNGTDHELQINQLAALGIVDGLDSDPTLFDPSGSLSRAQMAKFLVGAFEEVTGTDIVGTQNNFDDDDGIELEPEINAGFENQLFQGRAPRVYSPSTTVHRDQMASFLMNLVDRLAELGFPPNPS